MRSKWILDGNLREKWVRILAPAKINLFLKVGHRLPSGYHEIHSLMVPVTLADILYLSLSIHSPKRHSIEITSNDASLPTSRGNLTYRALSILKEAGVDPGDVSIHINKRIPVGGGLGGGSSDAAAVLKGIDYLLNSHLSADTLRTLSLKIGADVPFFMIESACMVSGIGEILEPAKISCNLFLLLCFPGFSISTKKVFQAFNLELTNAKAQVKMPCNPEERNGGERDVWELVNDLETPVFEWHPLLGEICKKLKGFGALEARMTGSGSTLFGIFRKRATASRAMRELQEQLPKWKFFLVRPIWKG